ncbi:MAG: cytochrome c [Gammaproteobacteria bacterium]|jgi:cytochrome c556
MRSKLSRSVPMLIAAAALAFTTAVTAQESFEQEVEYRQGIMNILNFNVKNIGSMLKGKSPYDAEKIKTHASDIAAVSTLDIIAGFPEDSVSGESDALEDIWMDFETFEQKLQNFRKAAASMNIAAQSGDQAMVSAAMKDLGDTCKGCHRKFKN